MAIISPGDIATYTQKTMTDPQIDACGMLIDILQGELETYLRRPVQVNDYTEVRVLEAGQTSCFFLNTPIISISSVSVGPNPQEDPVVWVPLDTASYVTWPWGIEFADPSYQLLFSSSWDFLSDLEGTQLQLVYRAGLDGASYGALRGVMLRAAAREFLAMASDVQNVSNLRAGQMQSYVFTDGNRGGFDPNDLKMISRYRRRVAA